MIPLPRRALLLLTAVAWAGAPPPVPAQEGAVPAGPDSLPLREGPDAPCRIVDPSQGFDLYRSVRLVRAAELAGIMEPAPRLLRRSFGEEVRGDCERLRSLPWIGGAETGESPTFRLLGGRAEGALSSAFPRDRNNGAAWHGKGVNMSLQAGAVLTWGPVTATLAPLVTWSQNGDFDFLERDPERPFRYRGNIDWPVRFGDDALWRVDPGPSSVRIDIGGVSAGLSNEHLWWGPGLENPVLFSNTAPGFPHVFLGSDGPWELGFVRLEVELVWGHLEESDHFDDDPDNDTRVLIGTGVGLQFPGLSDLTLGFGRMYASFLPPGDFDLLDVYVRRPYFDPRANPRGRFAGANNQIVSLFLRWPLPVSGLEVYAEWAREDQFEDAWDLVGGQPDHSQGYAAGFQKMVASERGRLRLYAEMTHLEWAGTSILSKRFRSAFYTNGSVPQGHTQAGQMLGAGIGPSGNAQLAGVELLGPAGSLELFLAAVQPDRDRFESLPEEARPQGGHDRMTTLGARGLLRRGALTLDGELGLTRRTNRDLIPADSELPALRETNLYLRLGVHHTLGGGRRASEAGGG